MPDETADYPPAGDDRCLLFFVKNPALGEVKTRLARSVGDEGAVRLYKAFVEDMLRTIDAAAIPCLVVYAPEEERGAVEQWLGSERNYIPQLGDDLGARMQSAVKLAFERGYDRVVLLGSDLPDIPGEILSEAFQSLGFSDSVIAPAMDGGYYLLGFNKGAEYAPAFTSGIEWSTSRVFEQTLAALRQVNMEPRVLPGWQDVDEGPDLDELLLRLTDNPDAAPATHAVLQEY